MNYSFFQKGRRKIPDLPSCSQAWRAKPEKQAAGAAWLDGKRQANQYNAHRPLGKIIPMRKLLMKF
ncbi:MAG: hypothetical protein IJ599_03280 [Alphaproteobacteria bacterium]|nr:hypothetical protein [Alphaproteobacteria bacterium]